MPKGLILLPRREATLGLLEVTPPKTGERWLGPSPFGRLAALVRVKPRVSWLGGSIPEGLAYPAFSPCLPKKAPFSIEADLFGCLMSPEGVRGRWELPSRCVIRRYRMSSHVAVPTEASPTSLSLAGRPPDGLAVSGDRDSESVQTKCQHP